MDTKFTAPYTAGVSTAETPYSSSLPSWLSPLGSALDSLHNARERLNLPDPGKFEDIGRQVKETHATQWMFDGAKADLAKTFSQMPAFQVTHAFTAGGSGGPMGGTNPGTYQFSAVYANAQSLLMGAIDNEGSLMARANHAWSAKNATKTHMQIPNSPGAQAALMLEQDRIGKDYTINLKAISPNPTDLTGTYGVSYLQSITPHFALGIDGILERPSPLQEDVGIGYVAKWHSVQKDIQGQSAKDSWIATAQVLPQGAWQATYWRKLAERIDAAVDLVVAPSLIPTQRRAIATAGVKYDFRQAVFRAQLDSTGKISALLEHRITPSFSFLLAGTLDHVNNTCTTGFGIQIESADEAVMEAAQAQAQAAQAAGAPLA